MQYNGETMHSTRIHTVINEIIYVLRGIGFWCQGATPTARELRIKTFYTLYYLLFVVSLVVGAITNKNLDESVFLAESSIAAAVVLVQMYILIWKQNRIELLLNRMCVFSIRSEENISFFKERLRKFVKFAIAFVWITIGACTVGNVTVPFIGSEKRFLFKMAFPLDWRNNEISFWIAYVFILSETFLSITAVLFSVLVWYLLLHCSLRYEILGKDITTMGQISGNFVKPSKKDKLNLFHHDLVTSIKDHIYLKEYVG